MPAEFLANNNKTSTNECNRIRLRNEMRAHHDAVDDYFNSYISSHPSPTQAYSEFLAIMSVFWTSMYRSDHWAGKEALESDLKALQQPALFKTIQHSTNDLIDPGLHDGDLRAVNYLFWGSAMGSRKLKQIFTQLQPENEPLPFGYFQYLEEHQPAAWRETLTQIEDMTERELDQSITQIKAMFHWLLQLMKKALLKTSQSSGKQ